MTLYLAKAPEQVLSFCRCEADALMAYPGQMDCPWCGCGWLFSCWRCRKAFTVATCIETPLTLAEIARQDIAAFTGGPAFEQDVEGWVAGMTDVLGTLVLGERYVYLDGHVHRADAGGLVFTGWHGKHALSTIPQVAPGATVDTLIAQFDRAYWQATEGTYDRSR